MSGGQRRLFVRDATPDDPLIHPIHATYGDEMDAVPLAAAWTKRNIAQAEQLALKPPVTPQSAGIAFTLDAAGDIIHRAAPTGDFEMIASLYVGDWITANSELVGIGCLDSTTGNGVSWTPYNSTSYLWGMTNWIYGGGANLGQGAGGAVPGSRVVWLRLKRATNTWTGYWSVDGGAWSGAASTTMTINNPIAFIGRTHSGGATQAITVLRFNVYEPTYV